MGFIVVHHRTFVCRHVLHLKNILMKNCSQRRIQSFRARVVETKIVQFRNPDNLSEVGEVVEAKFEVKEVFKGEPPRSGIVRDIPYGIGNCSLGLLAGVEYVFFPGENDSVLLLSGSFGFMNPNGAEIKKRLDELRNWGKRSQ